MSSQRNVSGTPELSSGPHRKLFLCNPVLWTKFTPHDVSDTPQEIRLQLHLNDRAHFSFCLWSQRTKQFTAVDTSPHYSQTSHIKIQWAKLLSIQWNPRTSPSKLSSPRFMMGVLGNRTLSARISSTHSHITPIGRQEWWRCLVAAMSAYSLSRRMMRPVATLRLHLRAPVPIPQNIAGIQGSLSSCIHRFYFLDLVQLSRVWWLPR